MPSLKYGVPFFLLAIALCSPLHAQESGAPNPALTPNESNDIRREIPQVGYAYTAYGATKGSWGAQTYGLGLSAAGQSSVLGGGASVWGAPVERLTFVIDAQRNVAANFSPSVAVLVRLLGDGYDGWSLGGLGKFKIDGFAAGPDHDEVESELELGALLSFAREGWHLDANAIGGRGLGDDGETDAEARLRFGYDLARIARLGLDGQMRARLAGPRVLPNGRTWDFAAGPQFLIGSDHFFGALTTGPTTMGLISSNVGWTVLASIGGTTF